MHYLFLDESYSQGDGRKTIIMAAWLDQATFNRHFSSAPDLHRTPVLGGITWMLESLNAWAIVAWADLDESLEAIVWSEISELLMNPQRVEREYQDRTKNNALLDNLETLRTQRTKLEHAEERLIGSFDEGLINVAKGKAFLPKDVLLGFGASDLTHIGAEKRLISARTRCGWYHGPGKLFGR
jgi:hypothetical protein